jgi:dCMP deaminase
MTPRWDKFFIKIAQDTAEMSKDRSTKVGAVLVRDNVILSTGWNGFPRGINDDLNERHERPLKYMLTEHAERNAIFNSARGGITTKGATIYMSGGGYPCSDCARAIIQAGIVEFVSLALPFGGKGGLWEESCRLGKIMLMESGVRIVRLYPDTFERISSDLNDLVDVAFDGEPLSHMP